MLLKQLQVFSEQLDSRAYIVYENQRCAWT
eukprot:COSAG01_NODE_14239_length_1478_cov_53.949964_2_plen_29_part_01